MPRGTRAAPDLELDGRFLPYFMLMAIWLWTARWTRYGGWPRGFALVPWFADGRLLAAVLTRHGETDRAEMLLRQHLSPEQGYVDPIGRAVFYSLTGDVDRMADWVEKAIEERQFAVFFFLRSHGQRALRSSPRWPAVARTLKLPE
jgi:hypothetical protein